jgi:hypothetical protein
VEVACSVFLCGFVHRLLYGGSAVWQSVAYLTWESVERTVSITFRCTFGLPVCLLVPFDLHVAWNPSDGDAEVAELLLVSCEFGV